MIEESVEEKTVAHEDSSGSFRGWLRSWRYFIWLLAGLVLIALFYAEENWRGKRAWQKYKRQMAARGEPLDPLSVVPPPVPMSENFAMTPMLAPLFEFLPGTQKWRSTNAMALAQGFALAYDAAARAITLPKRPRSNSWVVARTDLTLWEAAFQSKGKAAALQTNVPAPADPKALQQAAEAVLAGLSECDPAIDEIRAASQQPFSRFDIKYDEDDPAGILLPHLGVMQHWCRIIQLRAAAELALGRIDDAANDVNLLLYLTDASREEPIMISHLQRMEELSLAIQTPCIHSDSLLTRSGCMRLPSN